MKRTLKTSILVAAAVVPSAAMLLGASAAGGNMLTNGHFTTNTAGWAATAFPDANLYHGLEGTLLVRNVEVNDMSTTAWATQCVDAVTAGQKYDFSFEAAVAAGQSRSGAAKGRVAFYSGDGCTGVVVGAPVTDEVTQTNTWQTVSERFTAPAGTHSAKVMLGSLKDATGIFELPQAHFTVAFDDVKFSHHLVIQIPPTSTPTSTPTKTATPKPTHTPTKTPIVLPTSTATPTKTATPLPTQQPGQQPTQQPGQTATPAPNTPQGDNGGSGQGGSQQDQPQGDANGGGDSNQGGSNGSGTSNGGQGGGTTQSGDGKVNGVPTNFPPKQKQSTGGATGEIPSAPETGDVAPAAESESLLPMLAIPVGLMVLGSALAGIALSRRKREGDVQR